MNSPPPSDGILPSSQLSDETLYLPAQENRRRTRPSRREKRKSILTPRKFARFFTPRGQISSRQPNLSQPALTPLNDANLNARPTSPQLEPESLSQGLVSPSSSPIRPTKKRKITSAGPSDAGPSTTATETLPSGRQATTLVAAVEPQSNLQAPTATQQLGARLTSAANRRRSLDQTAPDASELGPPAARLLFPPATRQNGRAESGSELLKFFKAQRPRSQEDKLEDKTSIRPSVPSQPVNITLNIPDYKPKSFVKLENRGTSAGLLLREMGLTSRPGRRHPKTIQIDPFHATSRFFSRQTDWTACSFAPNGTDGGRVVIPFSVVSSRRSPVTIIGDEEGCIRMFESTAIPAVHPTPLPQRIRAIYQVHSNAIMDLDISPDDTRLATACGDRNGKIIDPTTGMCHAVLNNGHDAALRRVRFQPGRADGNVLSTCDKAGRIQIWDLRVSSAPVDAFGTVDDDIPRSCRAGILNTIDPAHSRIVRGRSNGASVTALQWLTGREHIVLSASEVDARIKVWDTRYINRRSNTTTAVPVSVTAVPSSHRWRDFGITSMALGGDASRLYAVCRDSTVYAYSTAHLVLGTDPVMSSNPPRQRPGQATSGHGPLYGFRHHDLDVRSFYIRCAVRTPDQGPGPELLAVGSSRGTAVLFPTDETTLRAKWDRESRLAHAPGAKPSPAIIEPEAPPQDDDIYSTGTPRRPFACRDTSGTVAHVNNGTSLKGGHQREVTGVSWTYDGKLATISDDMTIRHWQETPTEGHTAVMDVPRDARDLRTDRNAMKSHYAGWARVPRSFDIDDGMN